MKIYFIRHGETQYNKDRLFTGQTDLPSTAEGLDKARMVLDEIPNDFTLLYSSDFLRCKQMVEILNSKFSLRVIYDPRLKERSFGLLEGTPIVFTDSWSFEEKNKLIVEKGGESFDNFKERIFACIEDIKKDNSNEKILVVTSGGVIRLLYKELKNIVHEVGGIPNSSIHEFEL
jgi:broad specificity phosphatase PhoE